MSSQRPAFFILIAILAFLPGHVLLADESDRAWETLEKAFLQQSETFHSIPDGTVIVDRHYVVKKENETIYDSKEKYECAFSNELFHSKLISVDRAVDRMHAHRREMAYQALYDGEKIYLYTETYREHRNVPLRTVVAWPSPKEGGNADGRDRLLHPLNPLIVLSNDMTFSEWQNVIQKQFNSTLIDAGVDGKVVRIDLGSSFTDLTLSKENKHFITRIAGIHKEDGSILGETTYKYEANGEYNLPAQYTKWHTEPGALLISEELTFRDYQLNVEHPEKRFTLDALNLQPGTKLIDNIPNVSQKVSFVGPMEQQDLEDLAHQVDAMVDDVDQSSLFEQTTESSSNVKGKEAPRPADPLAKPDKAVVTPSIPM